SYVILADRVAGVQTRALPTNHPARSTRVEQVHAVTHPVGRAVREVDVEVLLELLALPIVHHVHRELRDGFSRQRRDIADGAQVIAGEARVGRESRSERWESEW